MKSALYKQGKTCEWVVHADKAHGFGKAKAILGFSRRIDACLEKNLAPR